MYLLVLVLKEAFRLGCLTFRDKFLDIPHFIKVLLARSGQSPFVSLSILTYETELVRLHYRHYSQDSTRGTTCKTVLSKLY